MITLFRVVTYLKFNYMQKNKSRGLGDSIDRFTRATGIKSLVQLGTQVAGKKDCGCNKRKDKLNKMFPYKK